MTTPANPLLPCPFCDGECQQPQFYGEGKGARFVSCKKCGANLYRAGPDPEENDRKLIAAWNRRALASAEPVAWDFRVWIELAERWSEWKRVYSEGEKLELSKYGQKVEFRDLFATPQPRAVSDAMVERALAAYSAAFPCGTQHGMMRAALEAALGE